MDAILGSHAIDPTLLRADAFEAFYAARKAALLGLVERAMGKAPTEASPVPAVGPFIRARDSKTASPDSWEPFAGTNEVGIDDFH